MKYKNLEIPGNTTQYEGSPEITIIGKEDHQPHLRIKYASAPDEITDTHRICHYGVLTFHSLFEYRWVYAEYEYPIFNESEYDPKQGPLIEIEDSEWIATMRSRAQMLRLVDEHPEMNLIRAHISHYQFWITTYGCFDILARSFTTQEVIENISMPE